MEFLRLLRKAAVKVAEDPDLCGCCASVSYAVFAIFGGEFIEGEVEGGPHFWNRLPDGTEVDLTASQFGHHCAVFSPIVEGETADRPELMHPAHIAFLAQMIKALKTI
ncbi:MAG: hypothetical protein IT428_31390 [Planctomycetaceae bacterium]|nr:hypothetical protein [Planctomycetaceae bacterium]